MDCGTRRGNIRGRRPRIRSSETCCPAAPRSARLVIAAAKRPLRDAWDLEEEHVPTAQYLARISPQSIAEALEMRTVHHDETIDDVGTHQRRRPCDTAAPIVAYYSGAFVSHRLDQIGDVANQFVERVVADSDRCVGLAVSAHLRRDAFETVRQCMHLMAPRVPALGKAVEHDDRPSRASASDAQS